MPPPSKIDQLPAEVRAELDRRLIANGFGGFVALSDWLSEQGFEISKSAVGVRGQRLKQRLAAVTASTEAMKMVAEAAPDDSDERSNAIISLLQTDLFEALVEFQEAAAADDEDIKPADRIALYSKAAKNIATLTRASVARNKWAAEVRVKIDAAAADVRKLAEGAGVSEETLKAIDRRLQGVV
ncbi:hypothetical protein [Leptolyngbya phage Lsp-JY19]